MTAKWSDLREAVGASPMRRRVIYIEDATWEELRSRSLAEGRSMSELIRRALEPAPDDTPAPGVKNGAARGARLARQQRSGNA